MAKNENGYPTQWSCKAACCNSQGGSVGGVTDTQRPNEGCSENNGNVGGATDTNRPGCGNGCGNNGWGDSSSWIWIILLLCLLVLLIAYNGLPDYLIPGDPYITRTAAVEMVSNMKNGASVKDAVFVFCKQILEGAGVY